MALLVATAPALADDHQWYVGQTSGELCTPIHGSGAAIETRLFGAAGIQSPWDYERFLNEWGEFHDDAGNWYSGKVTLEAGNGGGVLQYRIRSPGRPDGFKLIFDSRDHCEFIMRGIRH